MQAQEAIIAICHKEMERNCLPRSQATLPSFEAVVRRTGEKVWKIYGENFKKRIIYNIVMSNIKEANDYT